MRWTAWTLLLVLCWCENAAAADWQFVDVQMAQRKGGANFGFVSVDIASLVLRPDGVVKAWVRTEWSDDRADDSGVLYRNELEMVYFRCEDRTAALGQHVLRNAAGRDVQRDSTAWEDLEWGDVAPESLAEKVMKTACSAAARDTPAPADSIPDATSE